MARFRPHVARGSWFGHVCGGVHLGAYLFPPRSRCAGAEIRWKTLLGPDPRSRDRLPFLLLILLSTLGFESPQNATFEFRASPFHLEKNSITKSFNGWRLVCFNKCLPRA